MATARDNLIWEKNCLLNTRHDQPYRSGGHILSLNRIWNNNPELRDECKDEWLAAIEWCKEDPYCNDDKYFPEWKLWSTYFSS